MAKQIPSDISEEVKARFWAKVDARGPDECWLWTGVKTFAGYGRFGIMRQQFAATHVSLTLDNRPRLDSLQALHSCDVPSCVNPKHLRWGTHRDNMDDKLERGKCVAFFGLRNPNAMEDSQENRTLKAYILSSPKPNRTLAKELGKGSTIISDIRNGHKWKHVPPIVQRGDHRKG